MAECSKCGKEFRTGDQSDLAAAISGSIMGDESTDSYFFCKECGFYTVLEFCDHFSGDETVSVRGPVEKAEGDTRVALIRRCSRAWDKKCRCEARREYFGDCLD